MSGFEDLRRLSAIFADCAHQSAALVRDGTLSQALGKVTFSTSQHVQLWKAATPSARSSFEKAGDVEGAARQESIRNEVAHDFQDGVVKLMTTFQLAADLGPAGIPAPLKPLIVRDALGLPQMLTDIVSNYRRILGNENEAVNSILNRYETDLIPALPKLAEDLAAELGIPADQLATLKVDAYQQMIKGTEHIGLLPPDFSIK